MSLLDRGPHTVLVQVRRQEGTDRYNAPNYVDDGTPVPISGSMQPLTADETYSLGIEANTAYKFLCRTWPGGIHSSATWNGRPFQQVGEARVHSTGRRTGHVTVVLQAESAEPV